MHIEPGTQVRGRHTVTESDTASALETGDVAVLASSRAFAWCERASFRALQPAVPEGSTSVAMRVHMDHIKPSAVGASVTAMATLERIEGRRYVFVVSLLDHNNEELASGRIVRVMVENDPFLTRATGSSK